MNCKSIVMDCSIECLSAMNYKIMLLTIPISISNSFFQSQAAFSSSHISNTAAIQTSESSFSFSVIVSFTVVNILFKLKQGQTHIHTLCTTHAWIGRACNFYQGILASLTHVPQIHTRTHPSPSWGLFDVPLRLSLCL